MNEIAEYTGEARQHKAAFPYAGRKLWVSIIKTPLGDMRGAADAGALHFLHYIDTADNYAESLLHRIGRVEEKNTVLAQLQEALNAYFAGRSAVFTLGLDMRAHKPFSQAVWTALGRIPCGQTRSYAEQAALMGLPRSFVRAVGGANARNPFPIILPCHRVIAADGRLSGYNGGLWRKQALLEHEKRYFAADKSGIGRDFRTL